MIHGDSNNRPSPRFPTVAEAERRRLNHRIAFWRYVLIVSGVILIVALMASVAMAGDGHDVDLNDIGKIISVVVAVSLLFALGPRIFGCLIIFVFLALGAVALVYFYFLAFCICIFVVFVFGFIALMANP